MPLKLESFSREMTCILATVISTVSVRVAVMSLPAPLAIIGSARNRQEVETYRPVTNYQNNGEKLKECEHFFLINSEGILKEFIL